MNIFVDWAKNAYSENKKIVEKWEKSADPWERVLAGAIKEAAGGATPAN